MPVEIYLFIVGKAEEEKESVKEAGTKTPKG